MRNRSLLCVVGAIAASCALLGALLGAPPAQAAPPVLPSADPFYSPPGSIAGVKPGAILKQRVVQLGYQGRGLPATATQLLYRTTDEFGAPSSTVTTVISPPGTQPGSPRKIVSYHSFYDALGSQCDPSYTLRGGSGGGSGSNASVDLATITAFLASGYTVAVPDYEGPNLRWTIGRESGQAALDGVRAAEKHLAVSARTPVAMYGYSGGSIPTGFGSELAPKYAPELNIIGAAAGGVLVNPAKNLAYVNGDEHWGGIVPALMDVYNKTYDLNMQSYLSPRGSTVLNNVADKCITAFVGEYRGMSYQQLLKPGAPALLDIPGMRAATRGNVMGSIGTPRAPMMLGIGNSDGRGDGLMLAGEVAGLARSYCGRGVPTTLHEYVGQSHTDALGPWTVDAIAFVGARFAGQPAGGC